MFTPKKSEITKAVKAVEKKLGHRCEVTGYTSAEMMGKEQTDEQIH